MDAKAIVDAVDRQKWLNPIGEKLHDAVHAVYQALGSARRPVKDFMNGSALGHPLHPVLTDVTLGTWMTAAVLDAVGSVSGSDALEAAAETAIAAGLISTTATVAAGASDWMYLKDRRRRVGTAHALLNVLATGLWGASLALRRSGNRSAGKGLGALGLVAAGAAGYLGGELAFALRVGMNHVPENLSLPEDFVAVMSYDDLKAEEMKAVKVGETPILVALANGRVYAMVSTCSHLGGPLEEGRLEGNTVYCPWHGSRFSLVDGRSLSGPSPYRQPVLEVRLHNGQVEVRKPREET